MAVGMAASEGYPRCPQQCGGPSGALYPGSLTPAQAALRREWGCDKPLKDPKYTITCPRCDGSGISNVDGEPCDLCLEEHPGQKGIHRCPWSHVTPAIGLALRHEAHVEAGVFPAPGGLLDQSPSFIHFCSVLAGERASVQREEHEKQRAKGKMKAASKSLKRK